MPISETKRRNNDAYNAKCDRLIVQPLRPEGEAIRAAAASAGQSLQGYILQAVRDRMELESARKPLSDAETASEASGGTRAVSLPSDTLESVQTAAEAAGQSVNQWIIEAIKDKL